LGDGMTGKLTEWTYNGQPVYQDGRGLYCGNIRLNVGQLDQTVKKTTSGGSTRLPGRVTYQGNRVTYNGRSYTLQEWQQIQSKANQEKNDEVARERAWAEQQKNVYTTAKASGRAPGTTTGKCAYGIVYGTIKPTNDPTVYYLDGYVEAGCSTCGGGSNKNFFWNGREMIFNGKDWTSKHPPCITIKGRDWSPEKAAVDKAAPDPDVTRIYKVLDPAGNVITQGIDVTAQTLAGILGDAKQAVGQITQQTQKESASGVQDQAGIIPQVSLDAAKKIAPLILAAIGAALLMR
jgi:hypothetical protein